MKKVIVLGIVFMFSLSLLVSQDSNCGRKTIFGTNEICLPNIDGYKECYQDSIVKKLADATEIPINKVLGFYLNNEVYNKKDSLGLITFDDYFKIYGTKEIEHYDANHQILTQMEELLSQNFIGDNWDEFSKEIEKIEIEAEIGVPTFIDKYKINEESFSFVMLTKYNYEGAEPYTLAMTINGYLMNNRLIWMAYYLNYNEPKTIEILKGKSDKLLKELIEAGE